MPYYVNSPLDVGLGAAGALLQSQQAKKQQELENKRQAEIDRQNAALVAAQIAEMGPYKPFNQPYPTTQNVPAAAAAAAAQPKPKPYTAKSNVVRGNQASVSYTGPKPLGTVTATAQRPTQQVPASFAQRRQWIIAAMNDAMSQPTTAAGRAAQMYQDQLRDLDTEERQAQTDAVNWYKATSEDAYRHAVENHWTQTDWLKYQAILASEQNAVVRGEYGIQDAQIHATAAERDTDATIKASNYQANLQAGIVPSASAQPPTKNTTGNVGPGGYPPLK